MNRIEFLWHWLRVRAGNSRAFDVLFMQCRGVTTVCQKCQASQEEFEDCLQEVYLSAWKNRGQFRGGTHNEFCSWLIIIARNYCSSRLRNDKDDQPLESAEETERKHFRERSAEAENRSLVFEFLIYLLRTKLKAYYKNSEKINPDIQKKIDQDIQLNIQLIVARYSGRTYAEFANDFGNDERYWTARWNDICQPLINEIQQDLAFCGKPMKMHWKRNHYRLFTLRLLRGKDYALVKQEFGHNSEDRVRQMWADAITPVLNEVRFLEAVKAEPAQTCPSDWLDVLEWRAYGAEYDTLPLTATMSLDDAVTEWKRVVQPIVEQTLASMARKADIPEVWDMDPSMSGEES